MMHIIAFLGIPNKFFRLQLLFLLLQFFLLWSIYRVRQDFTFTFCGVGREEIEKKNPEPMEIWLLFPWWCKSCNVIIIGKSCKRRMKGNHFARLFLYCCCRVRKQKLIFVQGFLLTCNHANQNHPIFVILAAKKKCVKRHSTWHNSQRSMVVCASSSYFSWWCSTFACSMA